MRQLSIRATVGIFVFVTGVAGGQTTAQLTFKSASFTDGATIAKRFTCEGANVSPDVQLPDPPAGTKSFAIILDDPDVPSDFIHWVVYDIAPDTRDIPEGASAVGRAPHGADEGVNSFGNMRYDGPCPPGAKPHHYRLRLYALDILPGLPRGATEKQLQTSFKGHILAQGQITATYGKQ